MKVNSLINALARGYFLIDQRYADRFLPFVADIFQGKPTAFFTDEEREENARANAGFILTPQGNQFRKSTDTDSEPDPGSIYVAQLRGPVMKDDFCGIPGTATIRQNLKVALQHPNIASAIFITDTGGGAVDGTFELADEITALQESTGKAVIGFVDGMSCSAGYAIMAACSEIIASHRTAEVGSIGVCTSFHDQRERLKTMGVAEHYINASTSPDKNQDFLEARDGKYDKVQNRLDQLHSIFRETVIAGRPDVAESSMTGKVYLAEEALQLNLIDAIGTLEDAVNRAHELANPTNS